LLHKLLQMKMLSTTKLHDFLRSTTFVWVACSSEKLKYHYTLTYDYGTHGLSWC
jgi:hypothetical protein